MFLCKEATTDHHHHHNHSLSSHIIVSISCQSSRVSNHHPYKTLTKMAKQNGNTEPEQPNLAEAIGRLRALFEVELTKNPDLYHPVDIDRVRTEDWQVKRFLLEKEGNEPAAFQALLSALQWKQSFGVHDRPDAHYPAELWLLNDIEIAGQDRQGRLVQWGSIRNKRYFKPIAALARQFVAHVLERADRAAGEGGFVIVSDAAGGGLANVDLEMNQFNQAILVHYPQALKAMYIVDLPWLLNSLMRLMMTFVDPRLRATVHFVRGGGAGELTRYIDPAHIPSSLAGGRRFSRTFPGDLVPLERCYREHGLEEAFVEHFYKVYKLERTGVPKAVEDKNNVEEELVEKVKNVAIKA